MQISPFKIERYFAQYEFNVDYVLCASDCESIAIKDLLAFEPEAADRFQQQWLGYTESQGSLALRQEICRLYRTIAPAQVLVHSGAEEAIFLFMQAVLEPGDHVIVHWPCYQSLVEVARSIGCQVSLWAGSEANGWALDIEALRRHLRPDTRAIVINTPHNPTGYLMDKETFQAVHDLAQARGIILFSDEVYRESEYRVEDRLTAGCDMGDHAVSLGVLSKTYGLAGLRIGWIATHNQQIYDRMVSLKDYTTICNSAPSEFLAQVALRHREALISRNLKIITRNLVVLDAFFERHPDRFVWQRPRAGAIAFPRLIGPAAEDFCEALVRSAGVLLLPGTVFDDRENHFRLGFGRENLPGAVERLEDFLRQ
jgi:aspartate/methionine/tyrosine aminotransferase